MSQCHVVQLAGRNKFVFRGQAIQLQLNAPEHLAEYYRFPHHVAVSNETLKLLNSFRMELRSTVYTREPFAIRLPARIDVVHARCVPTVAAGSQDRAAMMFDFGV